MTFVEFVSLLRNSIVPNLVDRKISIIYPEAFSLSLASNTDEDGNPDPIIASAGRIGRAMKGLGLKSQRGSAGNAWFLPDEDELSNWMAGMG